jgi:hypothetical protein
MQNLSILEKTLEEHKPALLVIDPLQAFLGAGVDMHRANETRPVLAGIAKLAEKHGCAVLLIRHLGKSQADRAIYRGLGSIDFTAAARSVLLAGQDPQDPSTRAIIQTKNSLAAPGPSIGYEITGSGFRWTGLSNLTATQILAPDRRPDAGSKLDTAGDFMWEQLSGGPVKIHDILALSRKLGISDATLARARKNLGVTSYQEKGSRGNWFYTIPGGGSVDQAVLNSFTGDYASLVEDDPDTLSDSSTSPDDDPVIKRPETQAGQWFDPDQSVDHADPVISARGSEP